MSIKFILLFSAGVIIVGLLLRRLSARKQKKEKDINISILDEGEKNLDDDFYRAIQNGDEAKKLARVFSQMDLSILRSILMSKNIATQVLYQNLNNLRTGVYIEGFNDTVLVVLKSDYSSAKQILLDYIETRKKISGEVKLKAKIRNVVEMSLTGLFMNPNARLPELIE
jgi:hypothetical protein